jgi:hypothetical protein
MKAWANASPEMNTNPETGEDQNVGASLLAKAVYQST